MARAIWTGSVSFGLVSIPVALYTATEDHTIRFHQFQRGTADRVRYQRVNERTGDEVDYADIVKGYDVGGGEHVLVEPDELDDVAPGRSRTLDITAFVDRDEIDPVHVNKTYYLGPAGGEYARTYALLREALAQTNRAGIATFVMRNRQYLAALRAGGDDALVLDTLFFADEVREPGRVVDDLPGRVKFGKDELATATQLVESMTAAWDPEDYEDTYRARVEELVDAKRKGEQVVTEGEPPQATDVVDLMEALRRSVEQARGRRGRSREEPRLRRRPADADEAGDGAGTEQPERDLSAMSKSDLYALAGELEVPGRSGMGKDELAKAVRAARGKRAGGSKAGNRSSRRRKAS